MFPSLRPLSDEELARRKAEMEAEERERLEKDRLFLESLSPKERERVLRDRAERERRDAAADAKYWRRAYARQERLHDDAGSAAGRRAGQQVRIDRSVEVPEHQRRAVEG
jgi:hypothetical protein